VAPPEDVSDSTVRKDLTTVRAPKSTCDKNDGLSLFALTFTCFYLLAYITRPETWPFFRQLPGELINVNPPESAQKRRRWQWRRLSHTKDHTNRLFLCFWWALRSGFGLEMVGFLGSMAVRRHNFYTQLSLFNHSNWLFFSFFFFFFAFFVSRLMDVNFEIPF